MCDWLNRTETVNVPEKRTSPVVLFTVVPIIEPDKLLLVELMVP